jgi:hypothetical protein
MQRRVDLPATDAKFMCAFEATGLDRIQVIRSAIADTQAA